MNKLNFRAAAVADLEAITAIYNAAVVNTTATFDTEEKTVTEQRRWLAAHGDSHPVLVAERNGEIVGWASLSAYSDRKAYAATAEISLYVKEGAQGQGIGRELTARVIEAGRAAGLHSLVARIEQNNQASIHLAESFGFRRIGVMKEVGCKFGRLLDVEILQLIYQ